ncbi:MAG: hypothetical protein JWQ40_4548 [Segetibacter sp.]|jgi:hypothetical protein|nr:hypothetical protein [Segetibacter sp.]
MFFFRINKLKIFDNKEGKKFGLFGKDSAQVKLVSFVTTEQAELPNLTEFIQTNDEGAKNEILRAAVENVVSSRILTEIDNVKDNSTMTFGDTGFVLYQANKIPACFNWNFIAYESDKRHRETVALIDDITRHPDFPVFSGKLGGLLKNTPNPAFDAFNQISKFAIDTISKVAKENRDDMMGILFMSLNRTEHYNHGERKKDDVPDLTNNMLIDYSIFGFEESSVQVVSGN